MRDLAACAAEIGFAPADDYVVVERLFGDITADACQTTFQLGHAGKPLLYSESIRFCGGAHRRLEMVRA